jgi:hypothetical protein
MDWQQIIALAIVAAAAGLLFWGRARRRKFNLQRDTHCGCSSGDAAPKSTIVFHARKGQRPTVTMKMK